jgi:hypothetical protein
VIPECSGADNVCLALQAREEKMDDLGSVLMHVGSAFEGADMGEAFVDAWTVANKVSAVYAPPKIDGCACVHS